MTQVRTFWSSIEIPLMNDSTFHAYIFQENEEPHVKCMQVTIQIEKQSSYTTVVSKMVPAIAQ